ncbi:MAG: hypothetical protein LBR66_03855 [Candidatus Symbiothrix sp.]|jgi:nucleoid DNA-binding protein|nr:hypothetical protein [Candidatus Symbiothrix sp.]
MHKLNFYIAYLLTRQECVILPDFGAFVVSETESFPFRFLGFNSEIRHNDGLLANTVAKGEGISYQEACNVIKQYVEKLNRRLTTQASVTLPWIGSFSLSTDGKCFFTSATKLSCHAAYYGLEKISDASQNTDSQKIKTIPMHRQWLRWTGAVAASILALLMISTPLNKTATFNIQEANFIPKMNVQPIDPAPVTDTLTIAEPTATESIEPIAEPTELISEQPTSQRQYYIIIASLPTMEAANRQCEIFHEQSDWDDLSIISKDNRHRIYVAKFADKTLAESYLTQFRADHPQFQRAWLLAQ